MVYEYMNVNQMLKRTFENVDIFVCNLVFILSGKGNRNVKKIKWERHVGL